ncbi:hypothetical protein SKAU_G00024680 [Synaphobranchus kaupii]|uniref:Uncharacterized protein n=1 Tax=Synaphobranchus kaupii TaxID=118154 RepID=A0A9Q1JE97_SYNKA|nr:hypothetical protein SKAU_G00024680 [Synaphobranchus kaupii]
MQTPSFRQSPVVAEASDPRERGKAAALSVEAGGETEKNIRPSALHASLHTPGKWHQIILPPEHRQTGDRRACGTSPAISLTISRLQTPEDPNAHTALFRHFSDRQDGGNFHLACQGV